MRRRLLAILLVIVTVMPVGCNRKGSYDKALLLDNTVCLMVKKSTVFSYDPLTCQMAYNKSTRQFRAGTDTMSDYFTVRLSSVPSSSGQTVTGDVTWTTSSSVSSLSGVTFEVEQVDSDGNVWLWSSRQEIAAVVKILR